MSRIELNMDITDESWPPLLEQVCREGLIEPVFQPIVDLSRGIVCGYEGLARIQATAVTSGPQAWFAAAAWHGFSGRFEALALEAILGRRADLPDNCFLSVNLSPDAVLAAEVQAVLDSWPDLRAVVLEVTEQSPVEADGALVRCLDRLRDRGAMIAVDDTGAGYASIAHLLSLRPQFVKLDRSLITGIDRDPHRAAAVAALGAFAGELDAWIIAEGVEHSAELERLIDLGVPLAQGYFLGRPDQQMQPLSDSGAAQIRQRQAIRLSNSLVSLAQPAPAVRAAPAIVAEITVLIDDHDRPLRILEPAGGRRIGGHPAMCVQASDGIRNVALRAAGRQTQSRYAPICLCDDLGRLIGVISIDKLLETLARQDDTTAARGNQHTVPAQPRSPLREDPGSSPVAATFAGPT